MVQEMRRLHGKDLTVSKDPVKDLNTFFNCFLEFIFRQFQNNAL